MEAELTSEGCVGTDLAKRGRESQEKAKVDGVESPGR